jgi:ribonucleotide monophosphatase NagD (HAD superfamily)
LGEADVIGGNHGVMVMVMVISGIARDAVLGHSASEPEHARWSPVPREFLEPLIARLG